jgi:hypothetical protein
MVRLLTLSLMLLVWPPVVAQTGDRSSPPLTARHALPGPYLFYFERGSITLEAKQLEYLRNIPTYWNDGDGASVICSPAFLTGPSRDMTRTRQLDYLKAELAAVGIKQLFLTYENCPVVKGKTPPEYTVFAIYGVGRL